MVLPEDLFVFNAPVLTQETMDTIAPMLVGLEWTPASHRGEHLLCNNLPPPLVSAVRGVLNELGITNPRAIFMIAYPPGTGEFTFHRDRKERSGGVDLEDKGRLIVRLAEAQMDSEVQLRSPGGVITACTIVCGAAYWLGPKARGPTGSTRSHAPQRVSKYSGCRWPSMQTNPRVPCKRCWTRSAVATRPTVTDRPSPSRPSMSPPCDLAPLDARGLCWAFSENVSISARSGPSMWMARQRI
mmetsp:Transcript_18619/g.40791  ORF Transcript_18619/g.40791 Transcript_18619/m.40791 type:complete len:242 (+) Transcript_18619:227-952(+)